MLIYDKYKYVEYDIQFYIRVNYYKLEIGKYLMKKSGAVYINRLHL